MLQHCAAVVTTTYSVHCRRPGCVSIQVGEKKAREKLARRVTMRRKKVASTPARSTPTTWGRTLGEDAA